ncbi:MAG TPA: quinone-dependent dihydroorotate dehydrogenase [Anaerolineales bacterium]|nr:quinone-dependent dihydroorotate dehydrogenase [Anaerolineales bacterium]
MSGYESLRPLLFRLDAERAHAWTLRLLALAGSLRPARWALRRLYAFQNPAPPVEAFGVRFANPLGLAAGCDKNGVALPGLACLGFGHLELGTVTPAAQPGNPRPRLFRLPEDQALINRLGFPNAGAAALQARLRRGRPPGVVLGINIGKGADTPLERAAEDYAALLETFYDLTDYLAVNVSSPNTAGLRRLQARQHLEGLLAALREARASRVQRSGRRLPILVKLAPDLTEAELEEAVGATLEAEMDGIIATNTTLDRDSLRSSNRSETGGLSGRPLRERSTQFIRRIHALTRGKLPIVGVGGVFEARDVREKLEAGATLVQLYTGLVYRGPGIVREILRGLD